MKAMAAIAALLSLPIAVSSSARESGLTGECIALFQDHDAVPQADDCFVRAASAAVTLGTYYCTARVEIVEDYCGSPLPFYDEDGGSTDSDDGSSSGGENDSGAGDEGGSTDGGTSSGDGGGTGTGSSDNALSDGDDASLPTYEEEEVEIISGEGDDRLQDDSAVNSEGLPTYEEEGVEIISGMGDDRLQDDSAVNSEGLPAYEEDSSTGSGAGSALCEGPTTYPLPHPWFSFVYGTSLDILLPPTGLPTYTMGTSVVSVANLMNAMAYSEQTGDTEPLFHQIGQITSPLVPTGDLWNNVMNELNGPPPIADC